MSIVTDGRFLSAGSDQLHQDLDGHGPNLWQEVRWLDILKLVNLIQQWKEQVYRQKWRYKKWWNMTNFFYNILTFWFWLGFQIYLVKTLKLICQAPVRLIGKRGLICDHRNFLSKKFGRICLLWKYLLFISTAIAFRNF